jgi:hypothetical protein
MNVNEYLRMIAGTVVLVSVLLAATVHINFLWLTAFVGLNLLQSAFTKWCPMMSILRMLRVPG